MKKFLLFISVLAVILVSVFLLVRNKSKVKVVAINQFVSNMALDEATQGIESVLKNHVKIKVQYAGGSSSTAEHIARHQASSNPAFMVGVGVLSAQANLKARPANSKTVIGFVAVTDPVSAGLTNANNVIGVANSSPIEDTIKTIEKAFPDKRRIGVIFDPTQTNSEKIIAAIARVAEPKGFKLITSPVMSISNIKSAAENLVGAVDLIYIPQDDIPLLEFARIIQVANENKIPTIGNDLTLVDNGLLMGLGCDYFKSGQRLGKMILESLDKNETTIDVRIMDIKDYKINNKVASLLGIDPDLLRRAHE